MTPADLRAFTIPLNDERRDGRPIAARPFARLAPQHRLAEAQRQIADHRGRRLGHVDPSE